MLPFLIPPAAPRATLRATVLKALGLRLEVVEREALDKSVTYDFLLVFAKKPVIIFST